MRRLDAPRLALSFLTIVPVASPARSHSSAVAYFPLVGALVGAAAAALDAVLAPALPIAVVSVLDLALLALVSGGLHLDGLADATDGLFGGATRDERLRIMRDGGTGAFGVAAVSLVLLLEAGALAAISAPFRASALIAAGALSRWSMGLALQWIPSARSDGLAATFASGMRARDVLVATAFVIAIAVVALGVDAAASVALATLVVVAVGAFARSRVGGVTGDVCGAIGEIAFAGQLVLVSGLVR